jgi:hypothetical protein
MKSKASSYLVVSSVLIVLNLVGCGPSAPHLASKNPTHAETPAPSGPVPEIFVSKPPAVADEPPSGEKKRQAAEAGLTKTDLTGIWINEKFDRLLTESRTLAGTIWTKPFGPDCNTVALEFRENNPNPLVNISNHEGYNVETKLKSGELLCYGEESAKHTDLQGRFVLSIRDGQRCLTYKRVQSAEGDSCLPDGIVFCRPRTLSAENTDKYFRGLLAGRYVLEPGGQPVVLHEDGRVEGLNGYEQYDVDYDFADIHEMGDSGMLRKKNWETTAFHWKWQRDRLQLFSVYCGETDMNGCVPSQMKTGKILYVLRKTD